MAKLVLLLVAAAWAAVLIPPLLRSRIENRPNNSVSDFRDQLSSLQRAMPTRSVHMRTMGRGLVSSPLERPAASGRPGEARLVRGHRSHNPSTRHGSPAVRNAPAVVVPRSYEPRSFEPRQRVRTHGPAEHGSPHRRNAQQRSAGDAQQRRRTNVLFLLVLVTACSLLLAVATEASAALYVFALSFLALAGYVYLLGQSRQREADEQPWPGDAALRGRWLDVA